MTWYIHGYVKAVIKPEKACTDVVLVDNRKFVFPNCNYIVQERIFSLGDQICVRALGVGEVNRNDFVLWGIFVGAKV
jgi:hypothetical protein